MKIFVENAAKLYGTRIVFKNISFTAESGKICVISGPNGSGKSTLIKIMAGIIKPTVGTIRVEDKGVPIEQIALKETGFCAPYLNLYPDMTLRENLDFFNGIRGSKWNMSWVEKSGLTGRLEDPVRSYSSGMAQRAKLLFAVAHEPRLLFLDEPGSNLDSAGNIFVEEIVKHQIQRNTLTVIATNEKRERELGDRIIALDKADS
jgi:heme exporter protein A